MKVKSLMELLVIWLLLWKGRVNYEGGLMREHSRCDPLLGYRCRN